MSSSEAREWLAGPPEPLVRHLDNLTWQVLLIVLETPQTPDDWAEALREVMPQSDPDEGPLSSEESSRLDRIADLASQE